MGEKVSKTNVSARQNTKVVQMCKFCGKKTEIVLSVPLKGKKRFKRLCCEV
jgi:hypothetical protein